MLPVIRTTVRVYNQKYDNTDPTSQFMIPEERDVEVVQLNLNSCSMRVRFTDHYQGKKKVSTQDIGIAAFNEQFQIVPKYVYPKPS